MSYVAEKKALRRQCMAARDALDPVTRQSHSQRICTVAAAAARLLGSRSLGLYAPIGSEVDVESLLLQWVAAGLVAALPRMRADKRLDFVAVKSLSGLSVGGFGVREPDGPALNLSQLDLVIAPGLAFDDEGHRLGYGGGYYDRTLLGYTGRVIGVAFSSQMHPPLPAAPHDRRVDGIATELGFRPRRAPHNSGQTSGPVAP